MLNVLNFNLLSRRHWAIFYSLDMQMTRSIEKIYFEIK